MKRSQALGLDNNSASPQIQRVLAHVEMALRDGEAKVRPVLETAADAIVSIDDAGTIEAFNPAAERMFGYKAAEIVGRNVRELMPEPYRGEHDGYMARYLAGGEKRVIGIGREAVGQRRDGT